MSEYTRAPTTAKGSRVYAADGDELAVATRSSPRWRAHAGETARLISHALNSHEALVAALEGTLRQWRMYAEMSEERDLAAEDSEEGALYRQHCAALAAAQKGE